MKKNGIAGARAQDLCAADHLTKEEWIEEAHDIMGAAHYARGSADGYHWLLGELAEALTSPGDQEVP
jgi:hypothetical protein